MGNKHSLDNHSGYSPHSVASTPLSAGKPATNGFLSHNGNVRRNGRGHKQTNRDRERDNTSRHSPAPLPSSSAASSSSQPSPNANTPCRRDNMANNNSRKTGGGFLCQLFSHHQHPQQSGDKQQRQCQEGTGQWQSRPTTAQSSPPSSQQPLIEQQPYVLLPDRPAIRLDHRLVCKYEIISVVGKGSFSQVLRVQDRISKHFYAVKLVSTEQDFGAVNNELTILNRVKHPFVIRLEEVFRSATKLFIVMEMASGGEMYDRVVAKGRYTESEARLAIKMLLTGLDYLHRNLITHRDLKPENLLYSDNRPDARLLITDFGLAHQSRSREEKMSETCGTPEYIAPEILLRIPYTNRVDCWAVGVIAYILMSGIMPFDDDCRSQLYTHIITANYVYYPQFWSGTDQAKQFVDSLLEPAPEHRSTAVDALHHHWLTGERTANGTSVRTASRAKDWADDEEQESTIADEDVNGTTVQRTKSSRSIRSVTRSDHGHRVDPMEVDRLAEDLQRLANKQREHRHRSQQQNGHSRLPNGQWHPGNRAPVTKNYGVF